MKLFFDARYIEPDFHNGISRYSAELGNALWRQNPEVTFMISDIKQLDLLPSSAKHVVIHKPTSVKEPLTALILNKHRPDVVFTPMQTMGSTGRKFKLILTLHDLIYYQHRMPPPNLNPFIRLGWRLYHLTYIPQRLTLNSADVVATVSETVKSQFEDIKITKRPIEVITNAAEDLGKYLDSPPTVEEEPRNLVYMGSFMHYKNVELLIEGLGLLPDNYTLHLLSRISPERKKEFQKIIPKGKNIVFHNGVSDKKYAKLLSDRAIMVTASKTEGFGLNLVEAAKVNVPLVVSDIPIFHEVAGDGALYFKDTSQYSNQIKSLNDKKMRKELVKKASKHIEKFSWDKSAQKLESIMNNLNQ